jgi:hypothetical protein
MEGQTDTHSVVIHTVRSSTLDYYSAMNRTRL